MSPLRPRYPRYPRYREGHVRCLCSVLVIQREKSGIATDMSDVFAPSSLSKMSLLRPRYPGVNSGTEHVISPVIDYTQ